MSGTIRSPTYMLGTQWVDAGAAARDTPSTVRDLIESVLADFQVDQPVNVLPNAFSSGAVVGASGGGAGTLSGTLPTGAYLFGQGNLIIYVQTVGISAQGYPYFVLNVSGTSSTTGLNIYWAGVGGPTVNAAPITAASYTAGVACAFSSLTNITATTLGLDTWNSGGTYVGNAFTTGFSPTGTIAEFSAAGTAGAGSVWGEPSIGIGFSTSTSIVTQITIANRQLLLTSTATAYTAVLSDRGTTKKINSAAAFTVTIPSGVFSGAHNVAYRQVGAGAVSVLSDGTSVLMSSTGTYATRAQGSRIVVTADMDIPNLFWVDGDLA